MSARPLVLASASPRRRALLKALGLSPRVVVPRVREWSAPRARPHEAVALSRSGTPVAHPPSVGTRARSLVRHNACLKAEWVAARLSARGTSSVAGQATGDTSSPAGTEPARSPARSVPARSAARQRRSVVLAADTIVVLGTRIFGKPSNALAARRMLQHLGGRMHRVYTGVCVVDLDRGRQWIDVAVTRVHMRRLSRADIGAYVRRAQPWDKAGAYAVQDAGEMLIDKVDGSLSNVVGLPLDVVERRLRQCGILPYA